jgi:hypothetical protein
MEAAAVQFEIRTPLPRRSSRAAFRPASLALGIALLVLGIGTAWATVGAAVGPGLDRGGPTLVRASGSTPLHMPNGAPGDTAVSYTTIRHDEGGPAAVRLYGDVRGDLAPHLAVTIHRGTGEGAAFGAEAGPPLFQGTLASLPRGWADGLDGGGPWSAGERHTFRIAVTLLDHRSAQGTSARATFRWEARPAG